MRFVIVDLVTDETLYSHMIFSIGKELCSATSDDDHIEGPDMVDIPEDQFFKTILNHFEQVQSAVEQYKIVYGWQPPILRESRIEDKPHFISSAYRIDSGDSPTVTLSAEFTPAYDSMSIAETFLITATRQNGESKIVTRGPAHPFQNCGCSLSVGFH